MRMTSLKLWAPLLMATTMLALPSVDVAADDKKERRAEHRREAAAEQRREARQHAPRRVRTEQRAPRQVRSEPRAPREVRTQERSTRQTGRERSRRGNASDRRDVHNDGARQVFREERRARADASRTRAEANRERRSYDTRENWRSQHRGRDHQRSSSWWRDRSRDRDRYWDRRYDRDYSRGYWKGYRKGYRHSYHSWWYGVPSYTSYYYFGHWPYYSGYWNAHASWRWHNHHHHYHYGGYCPGFDYHYDTHYSVGYHGGGSGNVAGTILGGVIGGILGSEIDGGRNRSAGIVIGSLVGMAIGNAATSDDGYSSRSYDYDGYDGYRSNDPNRYSLEDDVYNPPREVRKCIEYAYRQGEYVCRKWEVEYQYDD